MGGQSSVSVESVHACFLSEYCMSVLSIQFIYECFGITMYMSEGFYQCFYVGLLYSNVSPLQTGQPNTCVTSVECQKAFGILGGLFCKLRIGKIK